MRRGVAPRTFAWLLTITGLFGVVTITTAQDQPERARAGMQILTDPALAAQTLDSEQFAAWVRPVIQAVEEAFKGEKGQRDVVVQVVLHKKAAADATFAGRPALPRGEAERIAKSLNLAQAPHTKLVDLVFRLEVKVNGGNPASLREQPLVPTLETPEEARMTRFRKGDTAARLVILRQWALNEALSALAATALGAEAKFEGVHHLGQTLAALDPSQPIDVVKLTDHNPDYWRALVEMAPGQPLVPASKIVLHVANGELDKARRLDEVTAVFDARESTASRVLADLRGMTAVFFKDVDSTIRDGVAAHDQKRFEDALKAYDKVLKDYPGSAWALYERFQTQRAVALAKGGLALAASPDWARAAKGIYACDPLYPIAGQAKSGAEAYFLFRRMSLNDLFKDQAKLSEDLIKYADVALDLEQYSFAAHLYWNATTSVDRKFHGNRKLFEHFLYCVERLGVTNLKDNFRGEHKAEFATIAAERKKLMEESPLFRKVGEKKGN